MVRFEVKFIDGLDWFWRINEIYSIQDVDLWRLIYTVDEGIFNLERQFIGWVSVKESLLYLGNSVGE